MYRLTFDGVIQRIEDLACIPVDERNGDYRQYLAWVAEGNEPEPYVEPEVEEVIPTTITMRQARLALLAAGKLSQVDAAIATLPSPQKEQAKIAWDYSSEVQRSNGVAQLLGPMLGLTEEQIDDLFLAGSKL